MSPGSPRWFVRWYGSAPLHLLVLLGCFAFTGYVVSIVVGVHDPVGILIWFACALAAHDVVLFPLYTVADRVTGRLTARAGRRVPLTNHVRVPALMSGVLLLVSFPLVFRLDVADYRAATGLGPGPYLLRWVLIAVALFAASAGLYLFRRGAPGGPGDPGRSAPTRRRRVEAMTGSSPAHAPCRRLPPVGQSASEARRFVTTALAEVDEDMLHTVALLTSEVVTNAILHAGTDLEVRVWAAGGRVHVSVFDEAPAKRLLPRGEDLEATTGRGLQLVELLASAHGTDISPGGKTVWFELWAGRDTSDPIDRSSPPPPAAGPRAHIELRSIPVGLCRAAGRHRRALLREGRLALGASGPSAGITVDELREASGLSDLIDAEVDDRLHTLDPGQPSFDCTLTLSPDSAAAAATLTSVLHRLNDAAGAGRLLTRPALPEIRHFRVWLTDQIASQAEGGPAAPWTRPVDPGDVAASAVDWALEPDPTGPATVAADDDNRIIAVNDAAGRLLGWDPDQLRGQRLVAIIPEDWRERHVTGFTEFLLTGHSRIIGTAVRLPARRRDGSVVEAMVVITVEQSRHGRTVFLARLTPADDADHTPAPPP